MSDRLARIILERVPALYQAAQDGDTHSALVAMRSLLTDLRAIDPASADALKSQLLGGHSAELVRRAPVRRQRPPSPSAEPWEAEPVPYGPAGSSVPADSDSGSDLLALVNSEVARAPVIGKAQAQALAAFLSEQRALAELADAGLRPRFSVLLLGPPGVGKTMTAAWIASELSLPLFQVDLSALISSFLGRTGQNIREVLSFARNHRSVILLDEFDALAKRRDDASDIGELKRIVSVLLKQIEEWPGPSVLVAASNHPELIDEAVFRRFQLIMRFEPPDSGQALAILRSHLGPATAGVDVSEFAAELLAGSSGSRIRDVALDARRMAILSPGLSVDSALLTVLAEALRTTAERRRFARIAKTKLPHEQRTFDALASMIGVSKATIHNYLSKDED